jgi:hypothetical protein
MAHRFAASAGGQSADQFGASKLLLRLISVCTAPFQRKVRTAHSHLGMCRSSSPGPLEKLATSHKPDPVRHTDKCQQDCARAIEICRTFAKVPIRTGALRVSVGTAADDMQWIEKSSRIRRLCTVELSLSLKVQSSSFLT